MANKRKLEVVITGDSKGLERAFGRSAKASDSFGRRLTRGAGKGMLLLGGGIAAAAAAGVAGVSIGLVKAGKAAAEAEASNARLSAQLKTLGKDNAAVKGQIDKTVQSLSMMSGFDDEDLQDAFTTLVRSSGNVAKSQKDIGLAADMAASGTMNLTTATKLINRVNNGSVTALKRYGIQVDENTTKEEAMAMLRKKFAGQAEAYGKTAAGAQARLGVAMENAFEQVGVALTPLIIEFANFATKHLPAIAASVSKYLGVAIAWLKTNWPQIRAVLGTVWDWYKTYVQSVVVPTFKAIASAIGTLIGFVRQHMPEIRAAFSAVFSWIQTNIVPTVRAIAGAVGAAVRGMTRFWREHGDDIKAILAPVFNTIKTVIVNALRIIKGVIEIGLALIRGDWGKAWSSFKTVVSTAIDTVITVLTLAPRLMWAAAKIIGREIIEGIKAGLTAAKDAVTNKLKEILGGAMDAAKSFLGISSSSKKAAAELGRPIARGVADGIAKDSKVVANELSKTVRDAVYSARQNLGSLTGGLAGMLGTMYGANSADAKRLRDIRKQQSAEGRVRERARLDEAIANAETDDEKKAAQQDLDDWLLEDEAARLEESIANQQAAYEENIRNLTASFNDGKISAAAFRSELEALIGGQTGSDLGYAFASEFAAQLAAVTQQIAALAGTPAGMSGPGVENPQATYQEELNAWQKARKDRLEELKKPFKKKDSDGGTDITKDEWKKITAGMERWDTNHPKPKPLAMGGILNRQVFTAGEAGPEAVIPLSSGRAQRMLAAAVDGVQGGRGLGATIINVTVNGNEFSARDFADKLAPELRRRVAMTRSA